MSRVCDFTDCEKDAVVVLGAACSSCGRSFAESNAFCAFDYALVRDHGHVCVHCGAANSIRLSEPIAVLDKAQVYTAKKKARLAEHG